MQQGVFQLGGQQLANQEEERCLAAAVPLPNTTNLSHCQLMTKLPPEMERTRWSSPDFAVKTVT